MKKLHLSIATQDYDHFRDFRTGVVQAEGIEHTWLMPELHEIFARFTANREWDVSELSFAKFMPQVTRKDTDILALPVVCSRHFRFSAFFVNKKSKIKIGEGPQGQEGRLAGMGAHRRRLHARLARRRMRRDAQGRALVPGRPQPARPHREGGAVDPQGRQAHPRRGQVALRHAGEGRDRLRAGGAAAGLLHARASGRGAAVPELSGDGGEVLRAHQSLADHARDRDQEGDPRAQSLGRGLPLQRLRGVAGPEHAPPHRRDRVALSAAVADDLRADEARPVRRRSLPLRHRREPPHPRSTSCATPTSRASPTATPRWRTFSRRG